MMLTDLGKSFEAINTRIQQKVQRNFNGRKTCVKRTL